MARLLLIFIATAALLPNPAIGQTASSQQIPLQIIVVDSPAEAQQILDRLRNGADFAALAKEVVAADYDNDGYTDFFVSNLNGDNFLFHNNHNRTFTEVGLQAGVQQPWQSFAAWFFDYDNDGWPDLFVTSYYVSVDESVRTYLGLPRNAETLKLYRNLGNGTFKDSHCRSRAG